MSENSSPKKTKTALFVGIGIAFIVFCCLCLAGTAALAEFTDLLPSISSLFGPKWASAKIIPDGTDFYLAANPNLRDMKNAKHLVDVYNEVLERTEDSREFEDALKEEYDISFKEDILPWLGPEVAIAIPDFTEAMNNDSSATAIIAATTNKKASDEFLMKLRSNIEADNYEVSESVYEGVTYYIQEVEEEWETPTIFGRLKNFIVLTSDEILMKEIIDTFKKNQDALFGNEDYTEIMDALPSDAAAVAFYDMEGWTDMLLDSMNTGVMPPEEATAQLEAFKAFGIAMSLSNEGVAFDFISTFAPEALPSPDIPVSSNEGNILERIPAGALGFVSSQNLDAGWHKLWASLAQNPDFEQQLDDFGNSFGITIDENLFSWTTGEYALTVVGDSSPAETTLPAGGYFIFEVSDQPKAEGLMSDISTLAQMALFIPFETQTIEGVEMQMIEQAGLSVGYGFPPEHLVIGVGEDALKTGISQDILPIARDETFQAVIKHLPRKNTGYVYINVTNSWELAYNNMDEYDQEYFDTDVRPYLEPLKAIGLAGQVSDPQSGITQGTLFFYIP